MKKILFIHDDSPGSRQACKFATFLAGQLGYRLVLASTFVPQHAEREVIPAGNTGGQPAATQLYAPVGADPAPMAEIDLSAMNIMQVAELVNKEDIWMIIKYADECSGTGIVNLDKLLSRVQCPLMLVPGHWPSKNFERIVYLADLRYCRTDIVRKLVVLASACGANLSVTHLTKPGLVHLEENYAHRLFDEQVCRQVKYPLLHFNFTREQDVARAADVLINGMQQDMLVVTKNRFHFKGLTGSSSEGSLPSSIRVPVVIFPG